MVKEIAGKRKTFFLKKEVFLYIASVLLITVVLFVVYDLKSADLNVPVVFGGDPTAAIARIKSIQDEGFGGVYTNPRWGAPGGADLRDYPSADLVTTAIMWVIGLFCPTAAMAFNIFILLSFYLVALPALYVFRQSGFDKTLSLTLSTLFSFILFHMTRLVHTMFILYGFLTFAFLICMRMLNRPDLLFYSKKSFNGIKPIVFTVLQCFLISMTGNLYYPFFAGYIILVAAIFLMFQVDIKRTKEVVINSLGAIGSLVLGLIINYIPYLIFWLRHGLVTETLARVPGDAETYALKLAQLILPFKGHRFSLFSRIGTYYTQNYPLVNENETAALGILGVVGLALLFLFLFITKRRTKLFDESSHMALKYLSVINIFMILMATVGGFSSLVSFVFSFMRGYNRISVCISFACFMALGYLITALQARKKRPPKYRPIYMFAMVLVLLFGLWDQTISVKFTTPEMSERYYTDQAEIAHIISYFDEGDMICQLPYRPYPAEHPYDYLSAYIHDTENKIYWSGGAVMGRGAGELLAQLEMTAPEERGRAAIQAGYSGILLYKTFDPAYTEGLMPGLAASIGTPVYETEYYALYILQE